MPGILFRHIFTELLKVLLVTTTVLVIVITFGAAIKPLSENVLGPVDLMKFMVFITVPMMQYALPFAAAFAGTVVYHRFTTDNEVTAMATSGMPYRKIFAPAVAMGILLTIVMGGLVDVGVPTFWQAAKRIFWNDGTRLLAAQSGRGEAWVPAFGKSEIIADDAYIQELDGADGATLRLVLDRVVAIELGDDKMPATEFTAQSAAVDQYRIADRAFLKIVLANATVFNRGENQIARATIVRPEAISVPTFEQGPKGLTVRELLAARHDLSVFPTVALARSRVLDLLDSIDLWRQIGAAVEAKRTITFRGTGESADTIYEVTAGGLRGRDLVATAEDASGDEKAKRGFVTIRQFELRSGTKVQRREVHTPRLRLTLTALAGERTLRFDLAAENATVFDAHTAERGGSTSGATLGRGIERPIRFSETALEGAALTDRSGLNDPELRAVVHGADPATFAGPREELAKSLDSLQATLEKEIEEKANDIVARLTQRSSQSVTVFLMLMNASILAVMLRNRTPLMIYVVAFLPAILNILLISGGEQMLRRGVTITGFVVAYGGNVLLGCCCLVNAWILRKH